MYTGIDKDVSILCRFFANGLKRGSVRWSIRPTLQKSQGWASFPDQVTTCECFSGKYVSYSLVLLYWSCFILGMVRSFNLGSTHAAAPVVTFVSAKMEVNIDWLQPLLDRLVQSPNSVVSPVLDKIDFITGEYSSSNQNVKGGTKVTSSLYRIYRITGQS